MSAVVIDAGGCLGTRETSGGYLVSTSAKLPSVMALLCPLPTKLNYEPDGKENYVQGSTRSFFTEQAMKSTFEPDRHLFSLSCFPLSLSLLLPCF